MHHAGTGVARCVILLACLFAWTAEAVAQGGPRQGQGSGGQGSGGQGPGGQERRGQRGVEQPAREVEPPDFGWPAAGLIDVHIHLASGGTRDARTGYDDAVAEAIKAMDAAKVRAAVVMPTPQSPDGAGQYEQDAFLPHLKRYPGRLYALGGGGSLGLMILRNPDADSVNDAVRRRFAAQAEALLDAGAIGFGEMTALHLSHQQGHPYHRARPDHPLFLLLADIAARRDVPIDLHMDMVARAAPLPPNIGSAHNPPMLAHNPPMLTPNLEGLERLLVHNRAAGIVLAHAGLDQTGQWTADLTRRLLAAHPNLYMSLKIEPRPRLPTQALAGNGRLRPEWREVLAEFPDRFVIGSDRFFAAPGARGGRSMGARIAERSVQRTQGALMLLSQLPPALARRIAVENPIRIYKLPLAD